MGYGQLAGLAPINVKDCGRSCPLTVFSSLCTVLSRLLDALAEVEGSKLRASRVFSRASLSMTTFLDYVRIHRNGTSKQLPCSASRICPELCESECLSRHSKPGALMSPPNCDPGL